MSDLSGARKYYELTTEIDDVTASSCYAHCSKQKSKRKSDVYGNWMVDDTCGLV